MNVFCMVKGGFNYAYLIVNGCCYRFKKHGDNVPLHIDQFKGYHMNYVSSSVDIIPHLEDAGFKKSAVSLGDDNFFIKVGGSVAPSGGVSSQSCDRERLPIPVEDVPIGSRITSIENADGEFDEFSFPVQRIEVSDRFITFMHYWPTKHRSYSYEVSIQRGTRVTYTAG